MTYIRNHLAAKLLLSYLAVILLSGVIIFIVSRLSLPAAYNHHMLGVSGMMNGGQGLGQGTGMMGEQFRNFRNTFYEALAYAGIVSVVFTMAVSVYFSRRIVAPITQMMMASQRISEGHYDERVQVKGSDELGQLGERFNQMAVELEQTETRRRQLIGDVSHELRTPLTSIKGSMEGLVDGVLSPSPDLFIQIQKEADRLNLLVDDLQELSRIESGAYQLQIHPAELEKLALITVKRLSAEAARKNITINSRLENLPRVLVDDDRIVQVLTNLISNAIHYTPENGLVEIVGTVAGNFVQVSVIDNGMGISPEHILHVFDRFYRVDRSRSRVNGGGSGIGLTISKSLVESHGGQIWVESSGDGKGSRFSFTLPAA
jgi:two-component system sensor histidine kinase BaeS